MGRVEFLEHGMTKAAKCPACGAERVPKRPPAEGNTCGGLSGESSV